MLYAAGFRLAQTCIWQTHARKESVMEFIQDIPIWLLAIVIFLMRVFDMTIGTLRTLTTVAGMIRLSMFMGFFESFIWLIAISQVVTRIHESPILPFFYAGGFATGVGMGLWLERQLGFGKSVLRIISREKGKEIAHVLRNYGQIVTTFVGEGRDGPVTELYIICKSKNIQNYLAEARKADPDLFYVVERANDWRHERRIAGATGWRSIIGRK
jgi:uncharacterized protein YebE (UPF0316 family)